MTSDDISSSFRSIGTWLGQARRGSRSLRKFYNFLKIGDVVPHDPTRTISTPKIAGRLPRVPSHNQGTAQQHKGEVRLGRNAPTSQVECDAHLGHQGGWPVVQIAEACPRTDGRLFLQEWADLSSACSLTETPSDLSRSAKVNDLRIFNALATCSPNSSAADPVSFWVASAGAIQRAADGAQAVATDCVGGVRLVDLHTVP